MSKPTPLPSPVRNKRTPRGLLRLAAIAAIVIGVLYAADQAIKVTTQSSQPPSQQTVSEPLSVPTPNPGQSSTSPSPSIATKPSIHRLLPASGEDFPHWMTSTAPLAEVLDFEGGMHFEQRLAAIHALPIQIAPQLSTALAAFVADPREPKELSRSQTLALRNDILNVLRRQENFHDSLRTMLQALAADSTRDETLRDYALQHLAALNIDGGGSDSTQWKSHWTAIEGDDEALATTAMLHLLSASRIEGNATALSESDQARLGMAALMLATDETTPSQSRATALQVCARLKMLEARQTALSLASSDEASFSLRIAAVATLGDLAPTPEVLALLQTLENGSERRLRVPAASSLNRLNAP